MARDGNQNKYTPYADLVFFSEQDSTGSSKCKRLRTLGLHSALSHWVRVLWPRFASDNSSSAAYAGGFKANEVGNWHPVFLRTRNECRFDCF